MKRASGIALLLGLVLAVTGAAAAPAADETKQPKPITVSEKVTMKATVEAIDKTNRLVTVKGPKGQIVALAVDESVQRFDQIKVGDQITAKYYESVVVEIHKPGDTPKPDTMVAGVGTLEGTKPAGGVAAQTVTTVTIEAIDLDTPAVTVKKADGTSLSFRVKHKKYLKEVKVGDQVTITQTSGLMVEVEGSK